MFHFRAMVSMILVIFLFGSGAANAGSSGSQEMQKTQEVWGYVFSLEDFQHHIILHKHRVVALGLKLKELFPGELESVSLPFLIRFLQIHDESKVLHSPELLKFFGYEGERLLVDRLYKYYGTSFHQLRASQKMDLVEVIKQSNEVDKRIAAEYLKSHGWTEQSQQQSKKVFLLKRLEAIVDIVDRGMDPTAEEEFHKPMQRGSQFLHSELEQKIAAILEEWYGGLPERYFLPLQCRELLK